MPDTVSAAEVSVIQNTRALLPEGFQDGVSIAFQGGKIIEICDHTRRADRIIDGSDMTLDDVIWTFEYGRTEGNVQGFAFADIDTIEATGPNHVTADLPPLTEAAPPVVRLVRRAARSATGDRARDPPPAAPT